MLAGATVVDGVGEVVVVGVMREPADGDGVAILLRDERSGASMNSLSRRWGLLVGMSLSVACSPKET